MPRLPRPLHVQPAACTGRHRRLSRQMWAMVMTVGAAAMLFATGVHAQGADESVAPGDSGATAGQAPAPRYAASELKRAFGFMDGNRDNRVSRQEASGFRGVAKNFDRADTNHDGFLSREEFDTAMNYVKPK